MILNKMREKHGFTLIETLVGLTIIVVLMVGAYTVWQRPADEGEPAAAPTATPSMSVTEAPTSALTQAATIPSESSKPIDTTNKIAFAKNKSIWLMNHDGSEQQKIVDFADPIEAINWSPDKSKVAYILVKGLYHQNSTFELRYFDFSLGKPFLVQSFPKPENSDVHYSFSWQKDSSGIVYSKSNEIWRYDIKQNQRVRLTDQVTYTPPFSGWNMPLQTTNHSVFFGADDFIGKLTLENPADIIQIVSSEAFGQFSISPDENVLVYNKHPGNEPGQKVIYKNLVSQEERELVEDGGCSGYLPDSFDVDSSHFLLRYHCADYMAAYVYNKAGKLIQEVKSSKGGVPTIAEWSPDGSKLWVIFSQNLGATVSASTFNTNGQKENSLSIPNLKEMLRLSWSSN